MEQKNKDQKKKRRILGICIPLLLLGIGGGATVGGLYAAGVFAPDTLTKVELSSVVGRLANWKTDISKLPVDTIEKNTGLTGAGYAIDQNQKVNYLENIDGIIKILSEDPKWDTLSEDEQKFPLQVTVSTAQSGTDPFKYVTVSAKDDSRQFKGSFKFVFWSSDKKVNLSDDITVTNLNAGAYEEYKANLSLTGVQLADVIKRANTSGNDSPDTNQMKLTYLNGDTYSDWAWDSTPESTPWGDGNTTKKIGIGEASSTDQVTSLKLWESTPDNDGWYAHLRLIPILNSAVYNPYNASDPNTYKDITLKIAKTDITSAWDTAKWTKDSNNQFIIQPNGGSVETKFQELFKAETWFQTLNTYETTWGFTGSGSNWVFTVKNNPFYTTQANTDSSSVPAAYKFETTVREKQNLSTLITVTDLNNYFYYSLVGEKYAREDVLYALKNEMGETTFNNIRWSDVLIDTSTDGVIKLSGDPQSVIYSSTDVKTITYTIIS